MASQPSSSEPAGPRGPGEPMTRRRLPTGGPPGDIRVAWHVDGSGHERTGVAALEVVPELLRATRPAVWVDLASPSPDEVHRVGAVLGLHPLIVEDVLEGNQRPKVEVTDGLVHLVLFRLEDGDGLEAIEVDFVLGKGFLLSIHDEAWDPTAGHQLRGGAGAILGNGPDHMLWALCDEIVDAYFPVADRLGDALDLAQDEVIRAPRPEVLEQVFLLKRELHDIRRLVSPAREAFNQMTNRDIGLIDADEIVYFRDIYDHLIRLTDDLDNDRELAAATLDVYLSQVNNNLSVIMKRLTGVTVILAGLGAAAGIFGMSEAGSALAGTAAVGFWIVAVGSIAIAGLAAWLLHRIDWI